MKKRLSPLTTALVIIAVLGVVLYAYTRGLLGKAKPTAVDSGGGGGGGPLQVQTGLPQVQVTTVAGYRRPGYADGQGWEAQFNGPSGIALFPDGSLCISDSRNHRLRRIDTKGTVTTLAGSGPTDCLAGAFADGPADQARFFNPTGLSITADGTVYIADAGNHRIRKLKDGIVTTVAGSATERDRLGFEQGGYRDGPVLQAQFCYPAAVTVDGQGGLYIADVGNGKIRHLDVTGVVTTLSETATRGPTDLLLLENGALVCADPPSGALLKSSGKADSLMTPVPKTHPATPTGVCELEGGALAIVDAQTNTVWGVDPARGAILLAGILPPVPVFGFVDGSGDIARFATPCAITRVGNELYVADFGNNCIRKLTLPTNWAEPISPEPLHPRRHWPRQRDGDRSAN
ncbi:MAG: NHL domain-containing protein [Candidatus Zipacnadales bacterium]